MRIEKKQNTDKLVQLENLQESKCLELMKVKQNCWI